MTARPENPDGPSWGNYPGGDLRSHAVTSAVSSAQRGLTTVFGMGTGVTPAVWPPGNLFGRSSIFETRIRPSRHNEPWRGDN